MPAPAPHTEIEELAGYLELQIQAIRASAHGLTEDQARTRPTRSALSIGGLVKHATYVMDGRARRRQGGDTLDEAGFARYLGSFALGDDETLASALTTYDDTAAVYLADVRASDPGADDVEPPAPWDGVYEPMPTKHRFYLVHHVEELARHAGHADIIREQIDGATNAELLMAMTGAPGNDFVKPWQPPS